MHVFPNPVTYSDEEDVNDISIMELTIDHELLPSANISKNLFVGFFGFIFCSSLFSQVSLGNAFNIGNVNYDYDYKIPQPCIYSMWYIKGVAKVHVHVFEQ